MGPVFTGSRRRGCGRSSGRGLAGAVMTRRGPGLGMEQGDLHVAEARTGRVEVRPETRARGWHRHRWTRRSHRVCTPDWPLNRARHAAIVHLGTDVRHLVNVDFRVERSVRRWGPTRRRSPVSRATHPRTLCGCPYRRGHKDAALRGLTSSLLPGPRQRGQRPRGGRDHPRRPRAGRLAVTGLLPVASRDGIPHGPMTARCSSASTR